ncbi:NAD(P)H-binding protein [Vibrio sp. YMD68]|uniref:NAD-dependent epimerase/dehydratase family protein n=1 Tax=Vibrio sp. YMD68 TaxID=3042300 RepID=UPI00249B85EB|nr:NAD-dependent epimerase/dehydratase family protein [Vibrio sp. YMD68]WGV99301.1 NAD(P)H-binding protein [Vibrio sp. YMD68]
MKTITIIGAGWLGTPLATTLLSKHHRVFASNTTSDKAQQLSALGIQGFICDLRSPHQLTENLLEQQPDVLIGCFPPGFRRGLSNEYQLMWQTVVEAAKQANVKKIIMISSTAVYPSIDKNQPAPHLMTEPMSCYDLVQTHYDLAQTQSNETDKSRSSKNGFSENAIVMLQAEQHVIDSGIEFVIARLSGLVGPNRHPARFVSKLKQVSRLAPANILHLDDAIGSLEFAISNISNQAINVTTPDIMYKDTFYQKALINAGLPTSLLPKIVDVHDKQIDPSKLISLGYSYRYPTLSLVLDALND